MISKLTAALIAMAVSSLSSGAAIAQTTIDCDHPASMETRACVFPEGKVVVETTIGDWTHDNGGGFRSDSIQIGSIEARIGIRRGLELQLGFDPYDHERTRDTLTGVTETSAGVGGISIGAKYAILSGRDQPLTIAIQPTLTVPLESFRIGSGGVGGGVLLPFTYDISKGVSASVTPQIDATGDRFASGRHLSYGVTAALDLQIARTLSATAEYRFIRDQDPDLKRSEHLAGLSFAWDIQPKYQLSFGGAVGLSPHSPAFQVLFGFARRFR